MNLRTANHNRRRAHRRAVLKAAFEFDMAQITRGRDRSNSRFVRRMRKASRRMAKAMLPGLSAPSRKWFTLETRHDAADALAYGIAGLKRHG